MIILYSFVTLVLIGMTLIAVVNTFTFPRLKNLPESAKAGANPESDPLPFISILIPARNEAAVIEQTVRRLLAQSYPRFELIVLDDHSSDATASLARAAGYQDRRLRIITGEPLPPGWLGKNWACHQLAQKARGDWLIFTDADVQWAPEALSALVAEISRTQADAITVWPTQQTESWSERQVVPLVALVVIGYLPLPLVHHAPGPLFAAANGQCLGFRREVYHAIEGHVSVRDEVLEDVNLARQVKSHGFRLRMADGAGLISCRMYRNWPEVRDGFAKNILAGYGGRISGLVLATVFHWLVFFMPWLWFVAGFVGDAGPKWPLWPLTLIGLGTGLRALTAAVTRQRRLDALLMPVSVLLMTGIAFRAIWWRYRYGGPRWKGRTIIRGSVSARGANG